jgi:hypothetical protein
MDSLSGKAGLDPEVKIGNDEEPLVMPGQKRRAAFYKLDHHNGLTNPFWGW